MLQNVNYKPIRALLLGIKKYHPQTILLSQKLCAVFNQSEEFDTPLEAGLGPIELCQFITESEKEDLHFTDKH